MTNTTARIPTDADILDAAKKAGFYFHDAGYAPILHTLAKEYSQKCFERLVHAVLAKWGAPAPAQDDSLTAAYMAGAHDAAQAARKRLEGKP